MNVGHNYFDVLLIILPTQSQILDVNFALKNIFRLFGGDRQRSLIFVDFKNRIEFSVYLQLWQQCFRPFYRLEVLFLLRNIITKKNMFLSKTRA